MIKDEMKIAILIDADNVSAKYIKPIMEEVYKYGTPTVKRIYSDWTKPHQTKWKNVLLNNSIMPIQQYSYTVGKNSSDSTLIIDAMDILYTGTVNGFCIVSSDSDFTRLAARLRESGAFVLGMGERKTAGPFIAACDKFTYLEVIKRNDNGIDDDQNDNEEKPKESENIDTRDLLKREVKIIINELSDDDGWVFLGELGNLLTKRHPSFDTRNYGSKKLTPLLESLEGFTIRSDKTADPNVNHKYIKVNDEITKRKKYIRR